jgi:hypothetical protein
VTPVVCLTEDCKHGLNSASACGHTSMAPSLQGGRKDGKGIPNLGFEIPGLASRNGSCSLLCLQQVTTSRKASSNNNSGPILDLDKGGCKEDMYEEGSGERLQEMDERGHGWPPRRQTQLELHIGWRRGEKDVEHTHISTKDEGRSFNSHIQTQTRGCCRAHITNMPLPTPQVRGRVQRVMCYQLRSCGRGSNAKVQASSSGFNYDCLVGGPWYVSIVD